MSRLVIVQALEALEVGDIRHAEAVLLGALEDGPAVVHRAWCARCGEGFEWPGLLDAHARNCFGLWQAA